MAYAGKAQSHQPKGTAGIAAARSAAFEILLKMDSASAHSDELLRGHRLDALSQQDRNLATTLVMGVLRWQIALDAQIAKLLTRPDAQLGRELNAALRLGAFQLIHLDRIPAHAAISESVELVKQAGLQHAAGMVNAILRKVAAAAEEERKATDGPFRNAGEMATAYGHPAWMMERWAHQYGLPDARKICAYDQQPPPLVIRLLSADAEALLASEGIELAPGQFLSRARRVVKGDLMATAAWRDGLVRIQDEGSQLVAELAAAGREAGSILDMCAAPGGKTAILAERNPRATLTACDLSEKRLKEMERLLPPSIAGRTRMIAGDASTVQFDGKFDLILADVPCSGTGTLARNPEIRHRLTLADLARQQERQMQILLAGMAALKSRGRLLYSSCSLEPEENEVVIEACLKRRREFHLEPLEGFVPQMLEAGLLHAEGARELSGHAMRNGVLRTVPGIDACDGFFAAMLVSR